MPRAKQRTPQLRAELLDAAATVLAEGGPASVTTRAVATRAETSPPAIYELFGDKSGLVRALFFEGFRRLQGHYDDLVASDDAVADLRAVIAAFRSFARIEPHLFEVMYSRPFAEFEPGPDEVAIGAATRDALVDAVARCIDDGLLAGDPVDIAHGLLALSGGLVTQENAGWLGSTPESVQRRWDGSIDAFLRGTGLAEH